MQIVLLAVFLALLLCSALPVLLVARCRSANLYTWQVEHYMFLIIKVHETFNAIPMYHDYCI